MFTLIADLDTVAMMLADLGLVAEAAACTAMAVAAERGECTEAELSQAITTYTRMVRDAESAQPRASHRLAPYCNDFEEVGGFIARLPGACSWANVQPVEVRSGDELLSAFTMVAPMRARDVFKWANDVLNRPEWDGYAADLMVNGEWIGSTEL